MGLLSKFKNWLKKRWQGEGHGADELARRIGWPKIVCTHKRKGLFTGELVLEPGEVPLAYWWHRIRKRDGGTRILHSPNKILKTVQRLLLRKVFSKLKTHTAAKGFRRGESIVTHAKLHVHQSVVVRIDIKNFFHSTPFDTIRDYFRKIGWNKEASLVLLELCTRQPGQWYSERSRIVLPQGAPTSPILSNLVNYRMDARLAGLAKKSGAIYSRYADDIIFSFAKDDRRFIRGVIRRVRKILWENGYRMHGTAKLRIMRRHQRQIVTGLVVNDKVQLPRKTRRWLRAVEHHIRNNRPITLTPAQLQGWRALQNMVQKQRVAPRP